MTSSHAGIQSLTIAADRMPCGEETDRRTARQTKDNEIDIITIGTNDADEDFLKKLASRTDLSVMVAKTQLEQGINSTVKMLP